MTSVDLKGTTYRPGQKLVKGHSLGTIVTLEEREVALVEPDGSVWLVPAFGATKPEYLRHPERAYIL